MTDFRKEILEYQKNNSPFIDDVLAIVDWNHYINDRMKKPWISCRDKNGNLYTVYPQYNDHGDPINDVFVVHKDPVHS